MIVSAPPPAVATTSPAEGIAATQQRLYRASMTSVNSVVTAIDARRPGLRPGKQHLLLFFCQGHHLAHFDEALFPEALYATDRGVVLDDTSSEPGPPIEDEGHLNTVGYVLARYSSLSPADLRTLIQASMPWQLAMKSTASPRIEWAWLTDWFRRPDETDDPDDERPSRTERAEAEAYLAARGRR